MTQTRQSPWAWAFGRTLSIIGGIEGALAALLFATGQGASAMPFLSLLVVGFLSAVSIAWLARPHRSRARWAGPLELLLGVLLTMLGMLSGFSVGPFILPGAILVLSGGLLLMVASGLHPLR
jgi:hypothetical protein